MRTLLLHFKTPLVSYITDKSMNESHVCNECIWHVHLELHRGLERVEVGGGTNLLLQGLQENFLEVQHLWKAAKKTFHLGKENPQPLNRTFIYEKHSLKPACKQGISVWKAILTKKFNIKAKIT